jgi:hypothetical protein
MEHNKIVFLDKTMGSHIYKNKAIYYTFFQVFEANKETSYVVFGPGFFTTSSKLCDQNSRNA